MPKQPKSKKSIAALAREANKRGETINVTVATASTSEEHVTDPDYKPPDTEEDSDGDENITAVPPVVGESVAEHRKHRREIADLIPESSSSTGQSRSTKWRQENGVTKKARAQNMQKSVLAYFKPIGKGSEKTAESTILDSNAHPEDVQIIDQAVAAEQTSCQEKATAITDASCSYEIEQDVHTAAEALSESELNVLGPGSPMIVDGQESQDQYLGSPMLVDKEGEFAAEEVEYLPESDTEQDQEMDCDVDSEPGGPDVSLDVGGEIELDDNDTTAEIIRKHKLVKRLVEKERKRLKKRKTLESDKSAANAYIDLAAIERYNDQHLKLWNEKKRLKSQLKTCGNKTRHQLRSQMSKIRPAMDASAHVASSAGRWPYFARTLRSLTNHLLSHGQLPESRMGQGAHHESYLTRSDVQKALQEWVRGTVDSEKGGYTGNMRPIKLKRYVNEFLFPELGIEATISESTAVRWLKKLGFTLCRVRKGVYVDGHERPDVVAAREAFVNYLFTQVLPFAYQYEGQVLNEVPPTLEVDGKGEQPLRGKGRGRIVHVSDFIIEHCGRLSLNPDEIAAQMKLPPRPSPPTATNAAPTRTNTSTTGDPSTSAQPKGPKATTASAKKKKNTKSSNEGRSLADIDNEWIPPPPPSPHTAYRLSNFDARRIIYPGANYDPWWDMPQLILQTKNAIEIFNIKYPDGIAVFIFDCSSAHEAFASDALLAHKMNRGPGGSQPVMHDTYIPSSGEPQTMVFPADYKGKDKDGNSLAGKPKGMEQVLRERGILASLGRKHGNKLVGVCGECKKSQAARDAAMREARAKQDEVEGSGVSSMNSRGVADTDESDLRRPSDCCMRRVLSLQDDFKNEKPLLQIIIEKAGHKCLFLPKFHCELNPIEMVWGQTKRAFRERADGTFATAKKLVPECLDGVSTANIRRYFQHCWRYMDAYKKGLNLKQAAYAVKKYKSHRRIPANVMFDLNVLLSS